MAGYYSIAPKILTGELYSQLNGVTSGNFVICSPVTLTTNLTIPSDVSIKVLHGGTITLTADLIINGVFEALPERIIYGTGSITFGAGSVIFGYTDIWVGSSTNKITINGTLSINGSLTVSTTTTLTGKTTLGGALNQTTGATLTANTTTDIANANGNTITINGTSTITSFGTVAAGAIRNLIFGSTAVLTHNATSLVLPTASNITTAAGDTATFVSLGDGNWKCLHYTRADGKATLSASTIIPRNEVAASGSTITYNAIPSWANKITITLRGISTNSSSPVIIRVGNGTPQNTGYTSSAAVVGVGISSFTDGFYLAHTWDGAYVATGTVTLIKATSGIWVANSSVMTPAYLLVGSGYVSASNVDIVGITTASGTATFDAGYVNVLYE